MNNRFFSHLVAREYTGKGDKSFFIKAKFSEEVRIQEEALKIFNLLEEFHYKYQCNFKVKKDNQYPNYHKSMTRLKSIYCDIAYSNPIEGIFENLGFNQFRCYMMPSNICINEYTLIKECKDLKHIQFLQAEFNKVAGVINKFNNDYAKSINLSFYFNSKVSGISDALGNLVDALQEALNFINKNSSARHYLMKFNSNTSLQISAAEMTMLCNLRDEILALFKITEKISGGLGDTPGIGGYSSLSDEDKKQYNELPTKFKNWQEALNIIDRCNFSFNSNYGESFKNFCSDLEEKILNLKNAIIQNDDYRVRGHQYSKSELEKFKFPRSVDDSRAKLKYEISIPKIKSHIR